MTKNTLIQIVDASEVLMKLHGYHGFSYADVADRVGIRKASIHHYFAAKSDLACESVRRYREQFGLELERISKEEATQIDRLRAFGDIFHAALAAEGSMCLCASLTADWESLPVAVQEQVSGYWTDTCAWLQSSLWSRDASPTQRQREARANAVVSLLEGALLCARAETSDQPLTDAIEAAEVLLAQ